jgi:hypothetical protein
LFIFQAKRASLKFNALNALLKEKEKKRKKENEKKEKFTRTYVVLSLFEFYLKIIHLF